MEYVDSNLRIFAGKAETGDSKIMPLVATWVQQTMQDIPEIRESEDHAIILWANMPTCGIVPATKMDFVLTIICNFLAHHPRNGIAFLVHPNRAAQATSRTFAALLMSRLRMSYPKILEKHDKHSLAPTLQPLLGRSAEKEEKTEKMEDEQDEPDCKREMKDDDSSDDDEKMTDQFDPEEADIRSIRYKLESLVCALLLDFANYSLSFMRIATHYRFLMNRH